MTEGQEGAKVKIVCPACGGSFKGRLPAKPARGTCPRCQKDLVLLPSGAIDTETQFRKKKTEKEDGSTPLPAGASPAAPSPSDSDEIKRPIFRPTGDAIPLPSTSGPLVRDKTKDIAIAAALFLVGWVLTAGLMMFLREKPQITQLGNIGGKGLTEMNAKFTGTSDDTEQK